MPHRVLGVDFGETSVKVAVLQTTFRQASLVDFIERPIPDGESPALERGVEVLGEILEEGNLRDVAVYVALPGDLLSLRLLELPFADEKKVEQVVPFELESQIPYEIDDVVIDHQVVATNEMAKVLCAAVPKETVRHFLDVLARIQVAPRAIFAAPLCYGALVARTMPSVAGPLAVLDIGHQRTNVCILKNGRLSFGRTLSRGGRHLTLAIASGFKMRYADAERGKREAGVIGSAAQPLDARYRLLDTTLREACAPLVRDLRQTVAYYKTQFGEPVERILLCGGTSRLRGLSEFLTEELGLPAAPCDLGPEDMALAAPLAERRAELPLAYSVALAGASGRKEIDFRKGEFSYKVDYSFLRAKAFHLATCFLLVLGFAAADAYAALHKLRKEEAFLEQRLRASTVEFFGKEIADPAQVSREILSVVKGGLGDLPIPEMTAYDLLGEISRKMPSSVDKKLDVLELDIRPKKGFIKGTVPSAAAVDEIVTALKAIRCFEEIQKGPIQNVAGKDLKQFTLTIAGKCP